MTLVHNASDALPFFGELIRFLKDNSATVKTVVVTASATLLASHVVHAVRDGQVSIGALKRLGFRLLLKVPLVARAANKELDKVDKMISQQMAQMFAGHEFRLELPTSGLSAEEILRLIDSSEKISNIDWRRGRASGTVYTDAGPQLTQLMVSVFARALYANPLHPDVFPQITKMEAEVVRMCVTLFRGDPNTCCGTLTSGGTESIILAVKAARDFARETRGLTRGAEVVLPVTAHAAFEKACQLLDMRAVFVPIDPESGQVDLVRMRGAISRRTVLLVGSACNYPHGIIDDIEGIAALGRKHALPVHVDACLGGFLLAFAREAGHVLPNCDLSVEGVTSLSCDTHKYAFAPKGSSVVLYASRALRHAQYSVQTDWPGGIYATPTLAGSRCGANIALCWATMLNIGREGYIASTRSILDTRRHVVSELRKVVGVRVVGEPLLSVVALKSEEFNIFLLSDKMAKRGWSLNPLQFPPAVHVCLTLMHAQKHVADEFLNDVKEVVAECLREPRQPSDGLAVVYGMAQSLPDRSMVSDISKQYIDGLYRTEYR